MGDRRGLINFSGLVNRIHLIHLVGASLRSLTLFFGSAYRLIRSLSTDDAYDKYLAHHACTHQGVMPLSRQELYMKQQQEKWTGVSRCC